MSGHDDMQDMGWGDPEAAKRSARKVAEMRRQTRAGLHAECNGALAAAKRVSRKGDERRLQREKQELADALAGFRLIKLPDEGASGLDDLGWGNPRAARSASRRLRLRYRLRDVQASIAALMDTVEHGIDPDCDPAPALRDKIVDGARRDGVRVVDNGRGGLVDSDDQREKDLLQGVDLVAEFFEALRSEIIHGAFSVRKKGDATPAPDAGHRLSEVAK